MTLRRRLLASVLLVAAPLVAGVWWLQEELLRRAGEQALRDVLQARLAAIGRARCEEAPLAVGSSLLRHVPPPPVPMPGGRGPAGLPPAGPPPAGPPPEGLPPRAAPAPGERDSPFLDGLPPRLPFAPQGRERGPEGPGGGPGRGRIETFVYDAGFRPVDPGAPEIPPDLRRRLAAGEVAAGSGSWPGGPRRPAPFLALRTGWDGGACTYVLARGTGPREPPRLGPLAALLLLACAVFSGAVWLAAGPPVRRIRDLAEAVRRSAASRYEQPVPVRGSDEVAALARAFNEAGAEVRGHLTRVEERERTLREFLADTTHDVMIPLSVLQAHLARLRRQAAEGACDPATVAAAAGETGYLASLVHNLSAAAKLEAGEPLVRRDPVDLGALVERVVERYRPLAGALGVELTHATPEGPLTVAGDLTLLEQAVGNLVHNSVRHNRAGGHAAVVLERAAAGFRLTVDDDGPGVPPDQLERLGERGFRARGPADGSRDGSPRGLGLAIARAVAARHGLTLRFSASEHGGLRAELVGDLPT